MVCVVLAAITRKLAAQRPRKIKVVNKHLEDHQSRHIGKERLPQHGWCNRTAPGEQPCALGSDGKAVHDADASCADPLARQTIGYAEPPVFMHHEGHAGRNIRQGAGLGKRRRNRFLTENRDSTSRSHLGDRHMRFDRARNVQDGGSNALEHGADIIEHLLDFKLPSSRRGFLADRIGNRYDPHVVALRPRDEMMSADHASPGERDGERAAHAAPISIACTAIMTADDNRPLAIAATISRCGRIC